MTPAGGWLLVPLVLALLCTGIGLLAERAARTRVPGPFLPGLGLAGLIAIAGLTTLSETTAPLAAPLCALAAVAGLALGRPWRDERVRAAWPWAAAAAAVAFAIVAGPSLLSGQASVAGYIKLDDSAIWLGLIDRVMDHGRDISGVPPSTFQLDLKNWLAEGYPVGTFTPVGVSARLTGQDVANAYQPAIAVYGAVLALGLYGCTRELARARGLAAACAVLGVQASLLLGYAEWGSIKEVAVAALLPALVGLAVRRLALAALVAGALVDCLGVGGVLWAGCGLAAGVLAGREWAPRRLAQTALIVAVTALPALAVVGRNADQTANGAPTAQDDLGKLRAPLDLLQGAGLWPAGDLRDAPTPRTVVSILGLLCLLGALVAVAVAVRRRAWTLPALVGATLAGGVPALVVGAPWIDAKILAITSPVLLAGAAALVAGGLRERRLAAYAGAAVLVAGCVWSSWLIARDVYVAPRGTLVELRALGRELAGRGPTLVLNYEGYATRYFLGPAQAEGATDLRYNRVPDRRGQPFPAFTTAEIDDVDQAALFGYRAIARRRTPVGSRPPAGYRSVHAGRFFEAWVRDPTAALPLRHVPLGSALAPAAKPACDDVRALVRDRAVHAVAAAPRVNPLTVDLAAATLPDAWRTSSGVRPRSDGTASVVVRVPTAGRWRVWLGGSTLGRLAVGIDRRLVGSYRHQLDASVGWLRFAALHLSAGRHTVTLHYSRGGVLRAGRGSDEGQLPLGPLALTPEPGAPVERVPSANADRFCDGRTYDWLETFR